MSEVDMIDIDRFTVPRLDTAVAITRAGDGKRYLLSTEGSFRVVHHVPRSSYVIKSGDIDINRNEARDWRRAAAVAAKLPNPILVAPAVVLGTPRRHERVEMIMDGWAWSGPAGNPAPYSISAQRYVRGVHPSHDSDLDGYTTERRKDCWGNSYRTVRVERCGCTSRLGLPECWEKMVKPLRATVPDIHNENVIVDGKGRLWLIDIGGTSSTS